MTNLSYLTFQSFSHKESKEEKFHMACCCLLINQEMSHGFIYKQIKPLKKQNLGEFISHKAHSFKDRLKTYAGTTIKFFT